MWQSRFFKFFFCIYSRLIICLGPFTPSKSSSYWISAMVVLWPQQQISANKEFRGFLSQHSADFSINLREKKSTDYNFERILVTNNISPLKCKVSLFFLLHRFTLIIKKLIMTDLTRYTRYYSGHCFGFAFALFLKPKSLW